MGNNYVQRGGFCVFTLICVWLYCRGDNGIVWFWRRIFIVPLLYALLTATADSHTAAAAMHIAVATSTGVMIFSASMATLRQHRAGMINWPQVRPLAGYIAAGAVAGALLAIAVQGYGLSGCLLLTLPSLFWTVFSAPGL